MAMPDPSVMAASIQTPFDFLSTQQLQWFAAQVAEQELIAIQEYFGDLFEPWCALRRQIRSLSRVSLTRENMQQLSSLLKQYRQLERHRIQWEARQSWQQYLAQAQAWRNADAGESSRATHRWENWQRHQAIAHWPSRAILRYAEHSLPAFQQYLQQARQEYQQKKSQCREFEQHRIQQFLTQLTEWITQQQQLLSWAILARLRLIARVGDITRDDLILETIRHVHSPAQNNGDPQQSFHQVSQTHIKQTPSTMTMGIFQAFNQYVLHHQPQLSADLRQLPWLHRHPAWAFSQDAAGWRIIPAMLQAYVIPVTRWWRRWLFGKHKQVADWLMRVQGLFIDMRLMPTLVDNQQACSPNIAESQLNQLQQRYQQIEQWQRELTALIPHRWNWLYRRLRARLLILQKQITLHQQQNLLQQVNLNSILVNAMGTLPSSQPQQCIQSLTQLMQWSATCLQHETITRTCQQQLTQIHAWQCHHQQQSQQTQLQQLLTAVTAQYSHEQAVQAVEIFIQLIQVDTAASQRYGVAIANIVQQLWETFKQSHQQVMLRIQQQGSSSTQWLTVQIAPLECLLCLFQQLKEPTGELHIETYFTHVLLAVCQQMDWPLEQQQSILWRTTQLQLVSSAPVPWVAQQARQLLTLEQENFSHFKKRCDLLRQEILARRLVGQPQSLLRPLTEQMIQRLTEQLKLSKRQQKTFVQCCQCLEQGSHLTQVMVQHARGVPWEKQQGMARHLLTLWANTWQTLHQQQNSRVQNGDQASSMTSTIKQLQRDIVQWLPTFNLFACVAVTPSEEKQETVRTSLFSENEGSEMEPSTVSRKQRVLAKFKRQHERSGSKGNGVFSHR